MMFWKKRIVMLTDADLMALRIWAREQTEILDTHMRILGENPGMTMRKRNCEEFIRAAERELYGRIERFLTSVHESEGVSGPTFRGNPGDL